MTDDELERVNARANDAMLVYAIATPDERRQLVAALHVRRDMDPVAARVLEKIAEEWPR